MIALSGKLGSWQPNARAIQSNSPTKFSSNPSAKDQRLNHLLRQPQSDLTDILYQSDREYNSPGAGREFCRVEGGMVAVGKIERSLVRRSLFRPFPLNS